MLKVDTIDEKIRNSDRIAMDWPGHILSNPLMSRRGTRYV
jgi:hypothetical protein